MERENLMTSAMKKAAEMLIGADTKVKEFAPVGYGEVKSTKSEQQAMFDNLDEGKLAQMISEHGREEVNKWLARFMR